ncbi:hypothetical protein GQ600_26877 [Phytophthora cactorum]|nr:hypothetical protein GQ600_26877 [Phytophthora cactorum]
MAPRGKRSLDMALEQSAKRTRPKRGSSPIQAKDTAKIDNSTFFKAVWRELREEGWTSKPPPRNALDLLYRYIRPGSSLKGQEGRYFFIGEQALLDFYLQEIKCIARIVAYRHYLLFPLTCPWEITWHVCPLPPS